MYVDTVALLEDVFLVVEHDAQHPFHDVQAFFGGRLGRARHVARGGLHTRDEHFEFAAQVRHQQFAGHIAGREGNLHALVVAHNRIGRNRACREFVGGKIEGRHIQRLGDAVERVERRVVDVAFDEAEKAGGQPGARGQFLQAQPQFLAALADALAKRLERVGAFRLAGTSSVGGHGVSVHPRQEPCQ